MLRTHTCGELNKKQAGKTVELAGWVHRRRDHGGIIFIDLRDRYGLIQLTFDPDVDKKTWRGADNLRNEWVIKVKGKVVARPDNMVNKKLKTGEIEIDCFELEILSESKTPPFEIDEEKAGQSNEHLRLKYRFLDLRRKKLQDIIIKRDKLIQYVRDYFKKKDFIEIQTPILANSSPEGARDYLVPSRVYPGKFYALPQAPQQFKQLLMVAGFDKYFQIAPCFRDEDPRADRHPGDFYQIDMEMSFVEQEDVWQTVEPLMIELTEKFSDKKVLKKPFPRLTYKEAMDKYGTDKPDLRFGLEIQDITDMVKNCGFAVFADVIKKHGVVRALKVENAGNKFSRKDIDELTEIAKSKDAKGLAYIIIKDKGKLQSPIVKFLGEKLADKIVEKVGGKSGDIIFFGADNRRVVCDSLGAVRSECGSRLEFKDKKIAAWCWIYDFPMYDYSELEEGKIDFSHNPFSMPQGGLEALNNKNPLEILAYQYDLACNGYEISSGAIRNHEPKIMYKAFEIAGYSKKQVDEKFGHMIRAFEYGAPPHGGFAPGIDRIMMILFDCDSIRDIYAFPKDGQARDVMMDSPSEVEEKQLEELCLKLRKKI
ncbi:aspartate--tRNA ligase [Candidatus Parcubacteria bacterium]|nr:aspartate--tRNA ligase [Patescibacteria group bacterium]MCG2686954.1 aspartate--tRNA ligase [Candidatus Parcubacteria bacterium]